MNYDGWLIYSKQDALDNEAYIKWFIHEALNQGLTLELILREEISIGIINDEQRLFVNHTDIELPTYAVVRTVEPLLNLQLEEMGVQVYNSAKTAEICNHKALTHLEVSKLRIPMVDTYFFNKKNFTSKAPLPFPFVIKEATGRGGNQVYLVENKEQWVQCRSKLVSHDVIVQRCQVQLGKDIRVFVVGKEIIGAVLRESKTDFRANFKLGGSAKWYALNKEETKLINKIIHHFDFGMVGIDFLINPDGSLLFNEIEDIVGSRTLSAVSNINILEQYTRHIKKEISGKYH
ncbi:RimK family alpha-L-glutamate ligase [Ornithinibacillus salinisoli]|uniref:RimK family alpha-L-glutamate ligase n=1 Tax=Ornithinibacillus salinisoli TaxID=1848459 RepID=A0ABW4W5B8_9BACI